MDDISNFAYSTVAVAPSPPTSGTTCVCQTGDGVNFPTPPFDLVFWPPNAKATAANAEITRCTGVSSDSFTFTRGAYGTTNQSIAAGWQMSQNITKNLLEQIAAASALTPASTVVGPDAFGTPSSVGTSNNYAREDHDHGLPTESSIPSPATTVTGPDAFGASPVVGTSSNYALEDHDHGLPIDPTVAYASATVTETNKRITKRVLSLSSNAAAPAIDTDNYDVVHITAQTATITSMSTNLTGTPNDGDELRISITGTVSVGITWGSSFESSTVSLPTTTSGTTRKDVLFYWNTETSKWRSVLVA